MTKCIVILLWITIMDAQQPAFPGAEGGGQFTRGGRGGKVLEVTSLADDGSVGTLRWAVGQSGARTIVFRVSGTIVLSSTLKITKDSITIAGQTAPGDGICLRKYPLTVSASQVIIRFIRSRLGDESGGEDDAFNGYTSVNHSRKNIIIDHCSASWSVDETMTFYGNDSLTLQWCIISESMYNSNHPKGSHGYGGIWGGTNSTFHHNLLAHHSSRNPRFSGLGTTVQCTNVDFRNNVIYNWGSNSIYGGEAGTFNIVGNYFKYGPATKSGVKSRIVEPYDAVARWYVADNYVEGNPAVTVDNWNGGVQGSYASNPAIKAAEPFPFSPMASQTAAEAFRSVLQNAGAIYPKRDTVDARIVHEAETGTATYDGKTYDIKNGLDTSIVRGIIDSQADVGGWPELASTPPPADTDHDGMPDAWETNRQLNPGNPDDRNIVGSDGYTMLEHYLNELAGTPTSVREPERKIEGFQLRQNFPNPFNPSTTIQYSLPARSFVSMNVFDLLGRKITSLINEQQEQGNYQKRFNASPELSSGVYFCTVDAGTQSKTIKLFLMR